MKDTEEEAREGGAFVPTATGNGVAGPQVAFPFRTAGASLLSSCFGAGVSVFDGLPEEAARRVQERFQHETGIPVPPASRIGDCRHSLAFVRAHMHDNQHTPKRPRRSTTPVPGQHLRIVVLFLHQLG